MLNFIGLYGLLLLPVGAVVFTEHWIFPKIGLSRYWVSHQSRSLNWPALVTWIVTIAFAMFMWHQNLLHPIFPFYSGMVPERGALLVTCIDRRCSQTIYGRGAGNPNGTSGSNLHATGLGGLPSFDFRHKSLAEGDGKHRLGFSGCLYWPCVFGLFRGHGILRIKHDLFQKVVDAANRILFCHCYLLASSWRQKQNRKLLKAIDPAR